jgi:hypothetical protein
MQVKVCSPNDPKRQFRPDKAFGLPEKELEKLSLLSRTFEGDPGRESSLQTLTWRTPALVSH